MQTKKITFLIYLAIILGCSKEDDFPDIYVDKQIYINMPEFNNVYNNPGGYNYLDGGLGGIIIMQGLNNNDFIAYDRACTFEKSSTCIISGESINDAILTCLNCCNSKFSKYDGSVIEGQANQALKRYNTYLDGNILYISN